VHLNFLPTGGAKAFGEYTLATYPDAEMVIVTGDIGEYHDFTDLIEQFAVGLDRPVYFVIGNHDAYQGSVAGAKSKAEKMRGKARYLPSEQLVELVPSTALVGADGWYDAQFGDAHRSNVVMSDFFYIKEIAGLKGTNLLYLKLKELGEQSAAEGLGVLEAAIEKGYKKVVFATHVPPFEEATWHEGATSDSDWLPWMSNKAMGLMLNDVAGTHPDVEFLVLCGHTHSEGRVKMAPNLEVLTGHSAYRSPRVCGVFDFK
jgi:predicted phosphohydrolase